jgi:hypothetical protein
MSDPTLVEIMVALADQIRGNLAGTADPAIEGLQVEPLLVFNPTPPSIDVYPADPFQEPIAFGKGNNNMRFTVRARVSTAEHQGGQKLLLSMMDPRSETSVALAILEDRTLNGKVDHVHVEGPSNYGIFAEEGGNLLGCTWTAVVTP